MTIFARDGYFKLAATCLQSVFYVYFERFYRFKNKIRFKSGPAESALIVHNSFINSSYINADLPVRINIKRISRNSKSNLDTRLFKAFKDAFLQSNPNVNKFKHHCEKL